MNNKIDSLLKQPLSSMEGVESTMQEPQARLFSNLSGLGGSTSTSTPRTHQLFNHRARSKLKNVNETEWSPQQTKSARTGATAAMSSSPSGLIRKWTCLVCLSKHLDHVVVCPICGSSKPDTAVTPVRSSQSSSIQSPPHVSTTMIQLAKSRYANLNQSKSMLLKNHQQFSTYLLNQLGYSNNHTG